VGADRALGHDAAQSDQDQRRLPQRGRRPQTHLPRGHQRGAGLDPDPQLDRRPTQHSRSTSETDCPT